MSSTAIDEDDARYMDSQIQHRKEYLARLDLYIAELEEDLDKAIKQRAKLRVQLRMLQHKGQCFINQLDDEALRRIFTHYFNACPLGIAELQLVCKRWTRLILDDHRMWNRIRISIPHVDMFWKYTLYATACIERSREAPLDIEIDFSHLISDQDVVQLQVVKHVKSMFPNLPKDSVDEWAAQLHYPFDSSGQSTYHRRAVSLLDHLVGKRGENIKRWRSLHLILPKDNPEFFADIWMGLAQNTPNLTSLYLDCSKTLIDRLGGTAPKGLPNLSGLERFTLHGGMLLSQFGTWNNVVTYLDFEVENSTHAMSEIVHFPALQELRLHGLYCEDTGMALDHTIHLPYLVRLMLSGYYDSLSDLNLSFPTLQDLYVRTDQIRVAEPPTLSPIRLHWTIEPGKERLWSDSSLQRAFRILLRSLSGVQAVTVPSIAKQSVRLAAADMRRKGTLPLTLTRVTVSGERNHGE